MKYEVGDVLFLISNKSNKIVPARVDSITTVKKIDREETTHELRIPSVERTAVLEKLDVKPFSDISDLRHYMLSFLEEKIDLEISTVVEAARVEWPTPEVTPEINDQEQVENFRIDQHVVNETPDDLQVELPGGGTARVHLPKELM